jgi:hypothetical protein
MRFEYNFLVFGVSMNKINDKPVTGFLVLVCWAGATKAACDRHSRSATSHAHRCKSQISIQNIVLQITCNAARVVF